MNNYQALILAKHILGSGTNEFNTVNKFIYEQNKKSLGAAEYVPRVHKKKHKIIFKLRIKGSLFKRIKIVKRK